MKFGRIKRQHGRVGGLDELLDRLINCPLPVAGRLNFSGLRHSVAVALFLPSTWPEPSFTGLTGKETLMAAITEPAVVGVFQDRNEAEQAVEALEQAGFTHDKIG